MPVVNTGPPIYTDAEGYVHLPGQAPVKFTVELYEGDVTHVSVTVKDELTDVGNPMERVAAENEYQN